jgi:hypothetical protein
MATKAISKQATRRFRGVHAGPAVR